MTSAIGQAVANWLHTCPGPHYGTSEDALWTGVHYASGLQHTIPRDEFIAAMDRAGYRPVERRGRWALLLPEGV
jgi:hypothetical protein